MTVADVLQKISEYHDTFHGRHCRPSRTEGVEARNRLLAAALKLFAEKGFKYNEKIDSFLWENVNQ